MIFLACNSAPFSSAYLLDKIKGEVGESVATVTRTRVKCVPVQEVAANTRIDKRVMTDRSRKEDEDWWVVSLPKQDGGTDV
jgi:hypothetical protein